MIKVIHNSEEEIIFNITDEVGNFHSLWSIQQTIKLVIAMCHRNPDDSFKLEVPELPWPPIAVTSGLPECLPGNLEVPIEWLNYMAY